MYCGKIIVPKYKDEEGFTAQGIHEPLISEVLFYRVQEVLNGRGNKRFATTVVPKTSYHCAGFYYVRGVNAGKHYQEALQKAEAGTIITIIANRIVVFALKRKSSMILSKGNSCNMCHNRVLRNCTKSP